MRVEDAAYLEEHGVNHSIVVDDAGTNIILAGVPLPAGLHPRQTDILITLPGGFNDTGPDMFWCNPAVTLLGGRIIPGTESARSFGGENWQRWSRHIGGGWRAGIDNLATYLAYVRRCLVLAAEAAA